MTTDASTPITIEQVACLSAQIIEEIEKAIVGKRQVLTQMMAAFLASGGHILLEDYPGLAKTLIANSFAATLGLEFNRIQFTPEDEQKAFDCLSAIVQFSRERKFDLT